MSYSYLEVQESNGIYQVSLNRPQVHNAFNPEMIGEMTQCFTELSNSSSAKILMLKGEGESFCAGGDLNWMKSMVNFSQSENRADSQKLLDMFESLERVPVPILCQVQGHCVGGGLGLVSLCDMVVALEGTQFCFSEVRLGLAPAVIAPFVIQKVPRAYLQRYFLTAECFDTSKAYEMGLIHFHGSSDSVRDFVQNITKQIEKNGPKALRATKKLLAEIYRSQSSQKSKNPTDSGHPQWPRTGELETHAPERIQSVELIAKLRVSPEGQEGLQAFFDRRKPNWIPNAKK